MYVELAKEVPNLVASKHSTASIYEIYGMVTTECPITFYLVDAAYAFGAPKGRCGLLNSFASLDMDLAWRYFQAGQSHELEVLDDLGTMSIEIVGCFRSLPREFIDSAYDQSVERVADPGFSNRLYPPYTGLSAQQFESVEARIKTVVARYRDKYLTNR